MEEISRTINKFKVKLFIWCREDAKREVEHDLIFLKKICGQISFKFCQYSASLTVNQRILVLQSLIKKSLSSELLDSISLPISKSDEIVWSEWQDYMINKPFDKDIEKQIIENFTRGNNINGLEFSKNKFRRDLEKFLVPIMGEPYSKNSRELRYMREVGRFGIDTSFRFGGHHQFSYLHNIFLKVDDSERFILITNFLRWLGIGETTWDFLTDSTSDEAIALIGELCQHFVSAMDTIVSDVEAD